MLQIDNLLVDQPALSRAIQILAGGSSGLASQAAAALAVLLAGVQSSPRQDAWEFSTLTQNGFPVELAFSSQEPSIRYTAEVAGPELDLAERLPQAERLLAGLGVTPLPPATMTDLMQTQAAGSLRWGAWIGARHSQEGDQYKLYVEVPRAGSDRAAALVERFLGQGPLLPGDATPLVAIGQTLGSSRLEFYFEFEQPTLKYWQVSGLLRRVGLGSRSKELLGFIEQARGYSLEQPRPAFPDTTYGFSYSLSLQNGPPVFSLFTTAGPLLGGDGQIRRRMLSLAEQRGWDISRYAALTEPLAGWSLRNEYHNAISFVIGPQGDPLLHISLSPPEVSSYEA